MTQALYTLNGFLMYQIGAGVAAVMGGVGWVLSVIGVYGAVSYSESQRTQEIGIRMPLGAGAQASSILRSILRRGAVIVAAGLVLGIACALASAKLVGKCLAVSAPIRLLTSQSRPRLTFVALAAYYIPARRSTRVNPIVALRHE